MLAKQRLKNRIFFWVFCQNSWPHADPNSQNYLFDLFLTSRIY